MRILAIDTSCDETSAAVTENNTILSNIIWSQAALHAKFGGIVPSLAQRQHEERIDWVIERAIKNSKVKIKDFTAIAVTIGPGLAIALGVGIDRAKKLAEKYNKPIIPVNHIEGHLLSCLAQPNTENLKFKIKNLKLPALGLVVSGGTTLLVLIEKIGKYKILAETQDDALGEALDKAARLLGLGYPGGAVLEKFAREGNFEAYSLPLPLAKDKIKNRFSYSGLKTAFVRLVSSIKNPSKQEIADLAASFQEVAFEHLVKVLEYQVLDIKCQNLLLGGGVANNLRLRKKLRNFCRQHGITLHIPYNKKLYGDNAAMIGVAAYLKLKTKNESLKKYLNYKSIDRNSRARIDSPLLEDNKLT